MDSLLITLYLKTELRPLKEESWNFFKLTGQVDCCRMSVLVPLLINMNDAEIGLKLDFGVKYQSVRLE